MLLLFTVVFGFLKEIPQFGQNAETTRNVFFHVPMWFGMMIFFTVSVVNSVKYLRSGKLKHDSLAVEYANVGLLF